MDLTPFKLDIDELLDDYAKEELTTLADMKRVWAAKKFTYLYEARPSTNSAFFMQSLFAHAIGYMVLEAALSRRLGGLYCLFCLYETQPYRPRFKIYLSLGELKRLKILVIDAKQNGIGLVPSLVKRMLDKNMLLFGAVDIAGGSIKQGIDDMTKLQNKRVQIAYEKLLSNTRIEDYVHMDLGAELDLEALKKMSTEYAKAKESAVTGLQPKPQPPLLQYFPLSIRITSASSPPQQHQNPTRTLQQQPYTSSSVRFPQPSPPSSLKNPLPISNLPSKNPTKHYSNPIITEPPIAFIKSLPTFSPTSETLFALKPSIETTQTSTRTCINFC